MKMEKIRGKISALTIVVCSFWIGAFFFTLDAVADEATMYELTVTVVSGHGTVEPISGSYYEGTVVTLTATPETGYILRQWTGTDDDTSCALTNTVTMDSDKTVTVEFGLPHHFPVVPGQIQEAIDAAACGDTLIVSAGVHYGNINFNGKDIRVFSTNPDDPNVVAYTIIQGTGTGSVVTFSGSESQSCILDGFTITGGNTAGDGGGICGNGTEATIANCVITNNHADGAGGGVSNCGRIVGCTITGNTAGWKGGGIYVEDCNVSVEDCDINYNEAADDGGGLCYLVSPGMTITRCTISDNDANGRGGGIFVFSSPILIEDCRISRNSAMSGGGVYLAGGTYGGGPRVRQCLITENTAGVTGGGISCVWQVEPIISNCTIADNQVTGAAGVGYGGGLHCSFASYVEVINSIIWGNFAQQGFQVAVCSGDEYIPLPSMLTISYSDVEGGPGGAYVELGSMLDWGIGYIDIDPLFVDAASGNYHLLPDSPCIDAGDPNYVAEPNETDLDGNPRIRGSAVDMGAYEFTMAVTTYDLTVTVVSGHGTVEPIGGSYFPGTVVTLTAIPEAGYYVVRQWTGTDDDTSCALTNTVTMDADKTVTVEFGLPRTILVGSEPNVVTIQQAIDAAGCGDTVIVSAGVYYEDINFNGKDIRVTSTHPDDPDLVAYTIIQGTGTGPVVTFSGSEGQSCELCGVTITGGNTTGDGGGISGNGTEATIANCVITNNHADGAGGGVSNCKGTISGCTISGNTAGSGGGGMSNGSTWYEESSHPRITNCTFMGNRAAHGGGIFNEYSYPTLTNCVFIGNSADGNGGGMYNSSYPRLTNCTFIGNTAEYYGGIWNYPPPPGDGDVSSVGGSSYIATNNFLSGNIVTNCIIWGNSDSRGMDESAQIGTFGITLIVNYSCVQGWTGGLGGIGNFGEDPLFVDADGVDNIVGTGDDNLRLLVGSPCIDAGDNSVVTVTTDLDGNPRIVNGTVDMGVYEFQGPFKRHYHVDGVNGDNTNNGLSRETAFETIQFAIDKAKDSDTILVWPGVYNETATNGINFKGKAITVKSAADAAVLEVPGFTAVSFIQGEDRNSVFSNFVIRGCTTAIFALFANPTINNVTIVDNDNGIIADNADPLITNSIFWNNTNGDLFGSPDPIEAQYSWVPVEVNESIAHWKLDGDATDSAGSNHGNIYGAAPTTGQIGSALRFDGVDDYVGIPYNSSLDIDASEGITLSVWIKLHSYPDSINQGPIFGLYDSTDAGTKNYLAIGKSIYGNLITWDQAPPSYGWIDSIKPDLDTWYHVVVTEDSSQKAIYINGTLDVSDNISESYQGNRPDTIRIGSRADGLASYYFDGIIDEVSIYDRALSAEEIEAIYEAGFAGLSYGEPGFVDVNGGDYHLLSERGRYRATTDEWILDDISSPCIDGGDPSIIPSNERMPNGGRINMGAYGNTAYASMSEWPIKGDVNNDGRFNFMDIAILLDGWLQELPWAQ